MTVRPPNINKLGRDALEIIRKYKEKKRKKMTDFITSQIRTWVPIAVGAIISWLATLGLQIDSNTQAAIVIALTGLIQAAYYTVVRLLEKKFPKLGILLGTPKTPSY